VDVEFQPADLEGNDWAAARYDVVVAIFDGMECALKPGGVLMLLGYAPE
jgi:hypothetical protein